MEVFGRVEYDSNHGMDTSQIPQLCITPFREWADTDLEGFCDELFGLFNDRRSEFSIYGAARLVWEFCHSGDRWRTIPSALALVDAGIDYKVVRDATGATLRVYEAGRLNQRRASGERI